jgi:(2Fe-2S) ferredoxin
MLSDAAHPDPHAPPSNAAIRTPTSAHLLVCTGASCATRGSQRLFNEVWAALSEQRIAYFCSGGSVRLTESGCLGACDYGPTVATYVAGPDGQFAERFYVRMTLDATVEVARRAHQPRATTAEE